jgi:hypothetical protein
LSEIIASNIIKDGDKTDYLKSTFTIKDSQGEHKELVPKKLVVEVDALKKRLSNIDNLTKDQLKKLGGLKEVIIEQTEREIFVKERQLKRLEKYGNFKI